MATFIAIIGISLLFIIGLFVYSRSGSLQLKTVAEPTLTDLTANYKLPSMWSNLGNIKADGCVGYTFLPTGVMSPPHPTLAGIQECLNSNSCLITDSTCVDDDTLFVESRARVCRFGQNLATDITEYAGCKLYNGNYVKINGYYEEYLATCTPGVTSSSTLTTQTATLSDGRNRCPGTLAILLTNLQSTLTGSNCLVAPSYALDASDTPILQADSPLRVAACSLSQVESKSAIQVFRVIRAVMDGSTFTVTSTGNWVQLIHRASKKLVAPFALDAYNVWSVASINYNRQPILVSPTAINTLGYWWYLVPALSGYTRGEYLARQLFSMSRISGIELGYYLEGTIPDVAVTTFPQLVFIANPAKVPNYLKDTTKALQYFGSYTGSGAVVNPSFWSLSIKSNTPCLQPFSMYSGATGDTRPSATGLDLSIAVNRKTYATAVVQYEAYQLAKQSNFQYMDVSLIHLLATNPSNYPVIE